MGEENRADDLVVYEDGQPVGRVGEFQLPEITVAPVEPAPLYSEEEMAAEFAAFGEGMTIAIEQAEENFRELWEKASMALEGVGKALADMWRRIMAGAYWEDALRWAEAYNRPLAWRYHHTKKKRTRKKYAKRILEWYREEIL